MNGQAAIEPYFPTSGQPPGAPRRGRLLLISYHFPPGGSAGSLRWQKLAHHAVERGWHLDVITQDPQELPTADLERLADVPAEVRAYGIRPDRSLAERIDGWLDSRRAKRSAVGGSSSSPLESAPREPSTSRVESLPPEMIRWSQPDGRGINRAYSAWLHHSREGRWARAALHAASRLTAGTSYDAVISCGPPHGAHRAAHRVAAAAGIPFIMDLRDPWSFLRRIPEGHGSPLWFSLARRDEKKAVGRASLVVANTPHLQAAFEKTYPGTPSISVMNGYDDEPRPETPANQRRFMIGYAGSLYLDRDPSTFLEAVAMAVKELSVTPNEFGVELIGKVSSYGGVGLEEMAARHGVEDFVRVGPTRPRREVLEFLAGASMLVTFPQDSAYAIPSKVFEYMRFDAWLLALSDPGTPVADLLADTGADIVAPADIGGIRDTICVRYRDHLALRRATPIAAHEEFSRAHQAKILFDAIDEIVPAR